MIIKEDLQGIISRHSKYITIPVINLGLTFRLNRDVKKLKLLINSFPSGKLSSENVIKLVRSIQKIDKKTLDAESRDIIGKIENIIIMESNLSILSRENYIYLSQHAIQTTWSQTYFYQQTEQLIRCLAELTKKDPSHVPPMTPNVLSLLLLIGMLYGSQYSNIVYPLVIRISQLIMHAALPKKIIPDYVANKLSIHQDTVTAHQPKIHWLLTFGMQMGIDYVTDNGFLFTFCYTLGTCVESLYNRASHALGRSSTIDRFKRDYPESFTFADGMLHEAALYTGTSVAKSLYLKIPPLKTNQQSQRQKNHSSERSHEKEKTSHDQHSRQHQKPQSQKPKTEEPITLSPEEQHLLENDRHCRAEPHRCRTVAEKLLGLNPKHDYSQKEIKKTYKNKMLLGHPDKCEPSRKQICETQTALLNNAWQVLSKH